MGAHLGSLNPRLHATARLHFANRFANQLPDGCGWRGRSGRKEMYDLLSSFVSAVSQLWKATAYHPERHYMRGPGPKWRETH